MNGNPDSVGHPEEARPGRRDRKRNTDRGAAKWLGLTHAGRGVVSRSQPRREKVSSGQVSASRNEHRSRNLDSKYLGKPRTKGTKERMAPRGQTLGKFIQREHARRSRCADPKP